MSSRSAGTICWAALVALAAGCGGSVLSTPDQYEGVADPAGFDLKFQPIQTKSICSNGFCYPLLKGYAHGKPIYFYELGGVTTSSPFAVACPGVPPAVWCTDSSGNEQFLTAAVTNHVYEFAQNECNPDPNGYDLVNEAYDPTVQYPVMTQFPLSTASFNPPVLPIAAVTSASGVRGDTCNDIKWAGSIDGAPCTSNTQCASGICNGGGANAIGACQTGKFGASSPSGVDHYALYGAIDMTANIAPITAADGKTKLPMPLHYVWSGNLQSAYLAGGNVGFDPTTNFLATMEAAITDPGAGKFAKITDQGVIVLPFAPGEAGYSPIVHLHDYYFIPGESIGTYTSLCSQSGAGGLPVCTNTAGQLDVAREAPGAAFNTVFIVAVGQ